MNYIQEKKDILKVQKYFIFGSNIRIKKLQVNMLDLIIIKEFFLLLIIFKIWTKYLKIMILY